VDAFVHQRSDNGHGRDLTGYEDGTENPEDDEAVAAGIAAEQGAGLDGCSYWALQQWEHDYSAFGCMSTTEQDHAVGRRRSDNEELDDAPESAHVKRTAQESFEPEAFVVRRSMPWWSVSPQGSDRSGLMFSAFGCSFDAFEAQMRRMLGMDDGISDGLFRFSAADGLLFLVSAGFWRQAGSDGAGSPGLRNGIAKTGHLARFSCASSPKGRGPSWPCLRWPRSGWRDRDSPAWRAASMTVTTDWCGELASALMMTTLSLPAVAAPDRAAATEETLRSSTPCLLTE
jgi:hypothetical protein